MSLATASVVCRLAASNHQGSYQKCRFSDTAHQTCQSETAFQPDPQGIGIHSKHSLIAPGKNKYLCCNLKVLSSWKICLPGRGTASATDNQIFSLKTHLTLWMTLASHSNSLGLNFPPGKLRSWTKQRLFQGKTKQTNKTSQSSEWRILGIKSQITS